MSRVLLLWVVSPRWVKPQSGVCSLAQHNSLASASTCLSYVCVAGCEGGWHSWRGKNKAPEHYTDSIPYAYCLRWKRWALQPFFSLTNLYVYQGCGGRNFLEGAGGGGIWRSHTPSGVATFIWVARSSFSTSTDWHEGGIRMSRKITSHCCQRSLFRHAC